MKKPFTRLLAYVMEFDSLTDIQNMLTMHQLSCSIALKSLGKKPYYVKLMENDEKCSSNVNVDSWPVAASVCYEWSEMSRSAHTV